MQWSAILARKLLALLLVALALPAAQAQEAAPKPAITVDPLASITAMPKQGTLLTGLYATRATIEICAVPLGEPGATAMNAHQRQLDCAEGSDDRKQADAVIDIYSGAAPK
jgi:hypothetical protein